MLGFRRRRAAREDTIGHLHDTIVEASRAPWLYGPGGLPDSVDGRFESLTLHVLVVLRRLRALPAPAEEVAQELVNCVFAHLEIALRESGVGDFGVPKRMKKLGRAFYDRAAKYEAAIAAGDAALAAELGTRAGVAPKAVAAIPFYLASAERALAASSLDQILADPPFAAALEAVAASEAIPS